MPKRKSEDVAHRRASNTMAKTNRTKGQTTICKTIHRTKDRANGTRPTKTGLNSALRKRQQFLFHVSYPSCYYLQFQWQVMN